jgi:hypothetical protein
MALRKMFTMLSLSTLLTLPQMMNAEDATQNAKHCADSDSDCGLSGIKKAQLLDSLYRGLTDLPFGLNGREIGFPADVLAAAYGIDEQGRKLSFGGAMEAAFLFPLEAALPHYYSYRAHRAVLSRLESRLAQAKLHMSEPEHAPVLVAVNVPGKGPRIYDADQLRALVATDLFTYPMHLEWKRSSGVSVPYVLSERLRLSTIPFGEERGLSLLCGLVWRSVC